MKRNHKLVSCGMYVEVALLNQTGECDRLAFTIVPDEQADFAAGFLGDRTPLARLILGQPVGSELPYLVEELCAVRILSAKISDQTPAEDVAARREAALRAAVSKAEYTNAMIFASAVNNKWGDYDLDGLDPEKWVKKT
jgi:hypothetical protein